MLVREQPDRLHLITQHDHGLLTGELAGAWRHADGRVGFGHELELAFALHDHPWIDADAAPHLDPDRGLPRDFVHYPPEARWALYTDGVDALERIHPYTALLVSLHYCTFKGMRGAEAFQSSERARRARLASWLGVPGAVELDALDDDVLTPLRWLKYFDLLSLFVCLARPSALPSSLPSWLEAEYLKQPPTGPARVVRWRDEETLTITPSPYPTPLRLRVPYRALPSAPLTTQAELVTRWDAAVPSWEHVCIVDGGQP